MFRVYWGFFGPRTARFSSFVRGPGAVAAYFKGLGHRTASHADGHNPLGGWSVVAMLLAVGGLETQGFKNQTEAFERAWTGAGLQATRIPTPHCNHFDLVNELEDPASDLTRATMAMMGLAQV